MDFKEILIICYEIRNMRINQEIWNNFVTNNDDAYGGACVKVAENVMNHLDTFEGDFNIGYNPDMTTPHGIICKCDDQGGITGFMAGAVTQMVVLCHKLGWKFYLADKINSYNLNNEEDVANVIDKLVECKELDISSQEAQSYVEGLKQRYDSKAENE